MKTILDQNAKGEIISNYSFDYDAGGKIKEEKGLNENLTITNGETIMTYGKGNRLLTYNGQEVKYDADGNMTYGPLNGKMVDFTYDARNRLLEAGGTTYQYDAENNRIGQITNGEQTTYVVDTTSSQLSRVLEEKKGDTVRQYIYGLGLIMHVEGGEYATYHFDNRGSTVAITNKNGSTIANYTYGPYGELLNKTGKVTTPFLYNGKYGVETDANGLYYMRARYYNPEIKRFINQDVVQGSLDNAITLNRFAYANGNPISYLDPFGTEPITLTAAAFYFLGAALLCGEGYMLLDAIQKVSKANYSSPQVYTGGPLPSRGEIPQHQSESNSIVARNSIGMISALSGVFVPDFEEMSLPNVIIFPKAELDKYRLKPQQGEQQNYSGILASPKESPIQIGNVISDRWDTLELGNIMTHSVGVAIGVKGAVDTGKSISGVFGNKSVGAAQKYTPTNINMVKDKYLKKMGIDAHQLKTEMIGNKNIAQFDLYVDKDTGMLWLYRKKGVGEPIPTYEYIK